MKWLAKHGDNLPIMTGGRPSAPLLVMATKNNEKQQMVIVFKFIFDCPECDYLIFFAV